jgi:pyruvate/2-oxoglutarate/acetoin dehydrogenase E1 component
VKFGGFMAEVSATITESRAFGSLQAPVRRLGGLDTPIPYNPRLEKASVPQVDDIVREATALVREW